jgi:glycosyltransferase involved in cell wall biosynthesis
MNGLPPAGTVYILLSTYNGAKYLPEQLESFLTQTWPAWKLLWRDDGSSDATLAIMEAFAEGKGKGRCEQWAEPSGRLGVLQSFLTLLRAAVPRLGAEDCIAFADQDDVWLPEKLARGMTALREVASATPALYCARQILADAGLRRLGLSEPVPERRGFPAALTQTVASGCTIVLNRAAARLIAQSRPPASSVHDWWAYLLVSAAGGHILADPTPTILYRQHETNTIGLRRSRLARGFAALRRGPGPFMRDFRAHLQALAEQADLLSPAAQRDIALLQQALAGRRFARLQALRMPGLKRRHWSEGLLFRLWFLLG